jgi:cytochrome P450
MTLKLKKKNNKIDSIPNLPPGPWKLPIIGNIANLIGSPPHRKLRDLAKKYGPLMHLQLGELFIVVVSSAEYAKEIMKTHDVIFASRPLTLTSEIIFYESTDIVFSPYGEYWRQLRKFCTVELLSIKRVQSFRPIREQEINNLVKNIASEEGRVVNLSQQVVSMMFSITSRAVFGKKYIEQDEFISEVREVMQLSSGFYIGDLFPSAKWLQNFSGMRSKLEKVHRNIDRILEIIIDDHKETKSRPNKDFLVEGEEDLIDVLLKFEEGSSCHQELSLTKRNIKAILFVSIFTFFQNHMHVNNNVSAESVWIDLFELIQRYSL